MKSKVILGLLFVFGVYIYSLGHFYKTKTQIGKLPTTPTTYNYSSQQALSSDLDLSGKLYIGPKQYQLIYRSEGGQPGVVPQKGLYILVNDWPDKDEIVLLKENYNACNIPKVTTQSFGKGTNYQGLVRFLIEYNCGDATNRKVLSVATNNGTDWVALPPIEIGIRNIFLLKSYTSVGWDSPFGLIFREITYDNSYDREITSKLVKLDIRYPDLTTDLE